MVAWYIYTYKRKSGDICAELKWKLTKQYYSDKINKTAFVGINVSSHHFGTKKDTGMVDRSKWT